MLNLVNHRCIARSGLCLKKDGIRYRLKQSVVSNRFYLLRKTKNVLGAKKKKEKNFHVMRFFKSFGVYKLVDLPKTNGCPIGRYLNIFKFVIVLCCCV